MDYPVEMNSLIVTLGLENINLLALWINSDLKAEFYSLKFQDGLS